MNWKPYLPTPKMARVIWGGLATVVLIFGLRVARVDITAEVAAVAPVIVASVWGWAKTDGSSPGAG